MNEPTDTEAVLKRFVEEFSKQISAIDRLATVVLGAHFILEKQLNEILQALARTPKQLDLENARFVQKVKWVRGFGPMADDKRWELVSIFNQLRNKVAHRPDGPERKEALQKLREELRHHLVADDSLRDVQEWGDYNVVVLAGMLCHILLLAIQREVEK
jgi:hypothetical protein